jgi:hypothetical protein
MLIYTHTGTGARTHTHTQADRQTDRQTDTHTHTHTYIYAFWHLPLLFPGASKASTSLIFHELARHGMPLNSLPPLSPAASIAGMRYTISDALYHNRNE